MIYLVRKDVVLAYYFLLSDMNELNTTHNNLCMFVISGVWYGLKWKWYKGTPSVDTAVLIP